jgi:hypothetical protein
MSYLANRKWGATSVSNLDGIRRANKFLKVRIFQILAKTRLLFLEFTATYCRRRVGRSDGICTCNQL